MTKQVFQTDNPSRWNRFKWAMRLSAFVAVLLCVVLIIMLAVDKKPGIPFSRNYKSVMTASSPLYQESKLSKEYKGFRDMIRTDKVSHDYARVKAKHQKRFHTERYQATSGSVPLAWNRQESGIRSAFYVAWDPQSYFSIKRNIHKLNLIFPEWFFIDPKGDTVRTEVDTKGYALMKKAKIPVMPMLSNNYQREFLSEPLRRILHDTAKQDRIINELVKSCLKHHFVGINLDLEEIGEPTDETLIAFVKRLSAAFHKNRLLVSQDIMPFNTDYNLKALSEYVDYFVLMAYDEYVPDSDPGPISSQRWIEAAVDKVLEDVPSEKVILGLAAYGYDWPRMENVEPTVTYQQALSRASASGAHVKFDNDTYNLSFGYEDEKNRKHTVYFTDAATLFNTMRFGIESELAGFALWRLGSEDNRLWKFYDKELSRAAVKKFDFRQLEIVKPTTDLDYVGDGEVLDIIGTPQSGIIRLQMDTTDMLIAEQDYRKIPSAYQVQKMGGTTEKKLCLTFDDGPDPKYTPQILDILKKYKVPGAFFVVGIQAERNLPLVKRIYDEGYLIGNHTFTHHNIAEQSSERTALELKMTRLLIEAITGHTTILFRAPYNADSEPTAADEVIPVLLARQQNYLDIGENIDPEDWQPGIKANTIVERVLKAVGEQRGNIILLHDAGGDSREETVKALPILIEKLRAMGYEFTTITDLLGKPKDVLMPPVDHGASYYAIQSNLFLATIIYWLNNLFYALFLLFVLLGFIRLTVMIVLVVKERKMEKRLSKAYPDHLPADVPKVSIIVPAYNEEVNAVSSLNNLLKQDYPHFDIVFVDDGSKDATYTKVKEALEYHPQMRIFTKPNGGKASALNFGIAQTDADFVVCIDADTKLYPDALSKMMRHFLYGERKDEVGAVAGNVKVGNVVNMITHWQSIEYTTSQNFDRMAYAAINAITVVPGAIGAFRKEAIERAGGFTTDTLAEDCDLTIRLLRSGYVIQNENKAVAVTEAPETFSQFIKQRVRWAFGVMQTFWKHRDALFTTRQKGLGLWALPNMLLFQFIIPYFSPLADLLMIIGLFAGNALQILGYYLLFMMIDASISIVAFLFEHERLSRLWWIIPQRFGYRWMMYWVMFKSLFKAIKGELQSWGVLKRTGSVKEI